MSQQYAQTILTALMQPDGVCSVQGTVLLLVSTHYMEFVQLPRFVPDFLIHTNQGGSSHNELHTSTCVSMAACQTLFITHVSLQLLTYM